jgi:type IV secretory pathway TrbL component
MALICCAFCLARRLLTSGNEGNCRAVRHSKDLIMLMALGAASAAWDAVKTLGSQMSSSSTQSSGFFSSGSDPFTMSGSDSAAPGSKKSSSSGSGKLSPAAMEAMLAAQGQFSMSGSNGSGTNPVTPAPMSSLSPISLDASSSASSSYNASGMMLQRAQLMSALA